ncbi:hypothetical protein NRB16_03980 [Pseudomonas sp. LJDD11]|uniref:hypothetical protein n=1 Tax=Pseudomonas sp. LJDD11 TaxID=2931984 RepID=UPI00211BB5EA|nr:hypothetical protein [Pseudomonas sp. LJDD11]MCQ9422690.1 hypothetical protein [Pseudomonas sp. LJDD11]
MNMPQDLLESPIRWSTLTSSEPETVTEKPTQGVRTEEGPWCNGVLTLTKQLGRLDVVYSVDMQESPFPDAGRFSDVLQFLEELYPKFNSLSAPRVGFGGVVFLPVADRGEGYERLKEFLPFLSIEDDMRDLYLQVNRQRDSDIDVKINNISKWSSVEIKVLEIRSDGASGEVGSANAVRLEFDINTADGMNIPDGVSNELVLRYLTSQSKALMMDGAI